MKPRVTLEEVAKLILDLNTEDIESLGDAIPGILVAKRAISGSEGRREDEQAADELRQIRQILDNPRISMNGPECVLLGSYFKSLEDSDSLHTRSLNVTLDSYGRKPSNTTSTVESLEKKGLMEFVTGEDLHAHKTFRLTQSGEREALDLLSRLARRNFSAVG